MKKRFTGAAFGIDPNGCPTEEIQVGDRSVVLHYDDVPESDVTTIRGLRVTTPIRTMIDLAVEYQPDELARAIDECLSRGLFTLPEMSARLAEPDMIGRRGADILRAFIARRG